MKIGLRNTNKKVCSICGGKASSLTSTKLADGIMCVNCRAKCTQHLSAPQTRLFSDIIQNIQENQANKQLYQIFTPSTDTCDLHIDFSNKLWCMGKRAEIKKQTAFIFTFSDIIDYEFVEDGNIISKSGAGAAIAGGLLFGGIGMLAGGLMGRHSKDMINKLSVIVKVKNQWVNKVEIPIITTPVKKGGATYNLSKMLFNQIIEYLDVMMS